MSRVAALHRELARLHAELAAELERAVALVDPPPIPDGASCIYVLRADALVKVGYTGGFAKRWSVYKHHNPIVSFVAAWPAMRADEKMAFRELFDMGVRPAHGEEWFPYSEMIETWARSRALQAGPEWWHNQDAWVVDPSDAARRAARWDRRNADLISRFADRYGKRSAEVEK